MTLLTVYKSIFYTISGTIFLIFRKLLKMKGKSKVKTKKRHNYVSQLRKDEEKFIETLIKQKQSYIDEFEKTTKNQQSKVVNLSQYKNSKRIS